MAWLDQDLDREATSELSAVSALLADDLFLLGHHLAARVTDYIDLEESLALGSMAQEDLAHGAELLRLDGVDVAGRHERVFGREGAAWRPTQLVAELDDSWPRTVVCGAFLTQGVLTLLDEMIRMGPQSTHDTANVLRREQELHARHWAPWLRMLLRDPQTADATASEVGAAAERRADVFAPADADAADMLLASLHRRWAGRVARCLEQAGARAPNLVRPGSRKPPDAEGPVVALLARVRQVRTTNPSWQYELYGSDA